MTLSDPRPDGSPTTSPGPLAAADRHARTAGVARAPASPLPPARGRWARLQLRLLHRVLTPGWLSPTSADRLRGWERVIRWREADTTARRLELVKRAATTPVRAWREAGEAVADFGPEVEAVAGVPPQAQRRQLWWLAVRHGMDALSYLDYELYRPERRRRAAGYLQEREFYRVARWLNRATPKTDGYPVGDKLRLFDWCRVRGLPAVPTLLEYEYGTLAASTLPGDPAAALPPGDLFSKPSDATGGHGTARWRYVETSDGAGGWSGKDGRVRSAAELLDELAHLSRTLPRKHGKQSERMLLQPCLRNHGDLLPLTPGGLCTVRVLTWRGPGERARALLAAYKMPTGDSPADNFHFGGIVAPVDLATGRLGPAIRRQGRVLVPVERHPDTGAVIAGHQLPHWAETVALAERATGAAHDRPSIGWDIAITDDGPVLVEGNIRSNPDIAQAPTGVPLSDTPFPAAFDAHVRARMGV